MIWATRQFGLMDWFETRDRFRYQYALMDSPEDMLLVATKGSESTTRLYVGVPSRRLLEPYEGFHQIPEAAIPKRVIMRGGDAFKFRESFDWPRR